MPPESAPGEARAGSVEADHLEQPVGATFAVALGTLVEPRAQRQVLVDRQILIEPEPLRHEARLLAARHRSRRRRQDARDDAKERRLAGAVGTDQREHLAALDLDRESAERLGPRRNAS